MKRTLDYRRGQTAILFTLALIPTLAMVGLVSDVGWAYFRREAAQTAADAAAGAAAIAAYQSAAGGGINCSTSHVTCYSTPTDCPSTLPTTPSDNIQAGCMYARDNGFVTGGNQRVTFQSGVGSAPTASGVTISYWVVARVSEQIPQLFSGVFGFRKLNITARTTTGARQASSGGCVITLNPNASASVSLNGTTLLQSGCGVFVNSNASDAITAVGGGTVQTTGNAKTDIVGNWSGSGTITPAPVTGVSPSSDPFAAMAAPAVGSCTDSGLSLGNHQSQTISPGVYCGGISLSAQSSLTLNPGLYIVQNGLSMGGQTTISGSGVTIYIKTGGVSMAGGATVNLTAPSSGTWQGILFFQDRADTTASALVGGTAQLFNGALYFPSASLTYTGGSSTSATATTIVSDTLSLVGNSYISAAASTNYSGVSGGVSIIE
jgi:hypothetical protein